MLKFFSRLTPNGFSPHNSFRRFCNHRRVQAAFDAEFYRLLQPALGNYSKRDLYRHYVQKGWKENIDPNAEFSVSDYLRRYQDVRDARTEPLLHYVTVGRHENRTVCLSQWGNFAAGYVKTHHLDEAMENNNLELIRQQLPDEIARLSDRAVISFVLVLGGKLTLRVSK